MPAQESSSIVQIGEWIVRPALDSIDRRGIDRVGLSEVVCVNNNQLCAGRISEALRQSLRRACRCNCGQNDAEQYHPQAEGRNHLPTSKPQPRHQCYAGGSQPVDFHGRVLSRSP